MDNQDLSLNEGQENVVDSQQTEQAEITESVNGEIATPQESVKPVQSAEENARFAEVRRKAEAEARDKMISEMYGDQGIHTYADYQRAVQEQQEEARREELRQQGIDPETFNKYVEENPVVKQAKELLEKQNQQKYIADQVKALEEYSPGIDVSKLDPSVVKDFESGKPLVDAYIKYENQQLKSKLEAFEKGNATLEVNNKNAQATPGSTTGNGSEIDLPLTEEIISTMSEKELSRRWQEVKKVLKMR